MFGNKSKLRPVLISFLAFAMLLVSGCGGCQDTSTKSAKKKKKAEKKKVRKPDYERLDAVVIPGVFSRPSDPNEFPNETPEEKSRRETTERMRRTARNKAKLGHWLSTSFPVIANHFNSEGTLSGTSVDTLSKSLPIPDTDYFVSTTRPASLPKKEWKYLESSIYLPRRESRVSNANVIFQLISGGVSVFPKSPNVFSLLKAHQFQFVILSNKPDAYGYIPLMDVIRNAHRCNDGRVDGAIL